MFQCTGFCVRLASQTPFKAYNVTCAATFEGMCQRPNVLPSTNQASLQYLNKKTQVRMVLSKVDNPPPPSNFLPSSPLSFG